MSGTNEQAVTAQRVPHGWAVFHDGALAFSADDGKWDTIGPALTAFMKPGADTPAEVAAAITRWLGQAEEQLTRGKRRFTSRDASVIQLLHCVRDLAEDVLGSTGTPAIPEDKIIRGPQGEIAAYVSKGWTWAEDNHAIPEDAAGPSRSAARARLLALGLDGRRADRVLDRAWSTDLPQPAPLPADGGDQVAVVSYDGVDYHVRDKPRTPAETGRTITPVTMAEHNTTDVLLARAVELEDEAGQFDDGYFRELRDAHGILRNKDQLKFLAAEYRVLAQRLAS